MQTTIAIPDKSRAVLEQLIEQRDRIGIQIEAVIMGVRTALDVPDDWQIASLAQGFVAPSAARQSNGAEQDEGKEGASAPG